MNTAEFLNELYPDCSNYWLSLWTKKDHKTYWHRPDDPNLIKRATNLSNAGHDVYFGVGLGCEMKKYKRLTNEDVKLLPGFWIDIDIKGPEHVQTDLPASIDEAIELAESFIHQPSIIVDSGHGVHAYWLFREPWELESQAEQQEAAAKSMQLQADFKSHANYKLDPSHDLSRVLRLPGTLNYKSEPRPVQVIAHNDIRYNPSDFEFAVLQPEPEQTHSFERRETDGPAELVICNCAFVQYCRDNAQILPEPYWTAMLSNVARCSDGREACHELSKPYAGYSMKATDKKINHVLSQLRPQSCDYIKKILGFTGCPPTCSVQNPASWALSRLPKVRALIRTIDISEETIFKPETLGALAVLKEEDPTEFVKFKGRAKGRISLRDLSQAMKDYSPQAFMRLAEPGETRTTKSILADAPIDLIIPNDWQFSDNGVVYQEYRGTNNTITCRASYVPVLITKKMYNIDNDVEKIEITFKKRKRWLSVVLPCSEVFDSRKIVKLADKGLNVSSETARYLVKWLDALQGCNLHNIPENQSVARMGWRGDNVFFPGVEGDYSMDVDDNAASAAVVGYRQNGSLSKWISFAAEARKSKLARFILAAAFATPLLKITGQRVFVVHNWGTTADGKTAALYLALSVWGDPEELRTSFDSTKTGIERKISLYNDLPFGLNERETIRDKNQDSITSLLYMLGEGKGRTRATRTGLQTTASWRTIVLSTGEATVANDAVTAGARTRVLEIYRGPWPGDEDYSKTIYRNTAEHHGHAGIEFVRRLIKSDWEPVKELYRKTAHKFKADHPDKLDSHIDAVSCVMVADYLISQWLFGDHENKAAQESHAACDHILSMLTTRQEASDAARATEFIGDWIEANKSKFSSKAVPLSYGFMDSEQVCINPTIFADALNERGFSPTKVLRELAADGKLETAQEGGKTVYKIKKGNPEDKSMRSRFVVLIRKYFD